MADDISSWSNPAGGRIQPGTVEGIISFYEGAVRHAFARSSVLFYSGEASGSDLSYGLCIRHVQRTGVQYLGYTGRDFW